ncbi:hypothetical protein IAT38_000900 [Cryptococcus sp. DSM 104549]
MPPFLLTLLALLALSPAALARAQFYFQWASSTKQCDVVHLSWADASPPLTAWVIPIDAQPFIYEIPDSATVDGSGSYDVLLQVQTDYKYVVMMSDGYGLGSGGTSEIQTVKASSNSTCLNTAYQNSTSLDFTFTVSGQAQQCQRGFEMSWTGGREYGPYNFTVIPLDQGFIPFDVTLENDVTYQSDWVMNLANGTRFTIVMNSQLGYGRGGVAGIYAVNGGNSSQCITRPTQATGVWPATVTTDTLDAATLPITQSAHPSSSSSSGLSHGAIAGIAVGAAAAVLLVILALFCLLRRKRRRGMTAQAIKDHQVDLADDYPSPPSISGRGRTGSQPMIEPYRAVGSFSPDSESTPKDSTDSYFLPLPPQSSAASSAGFAGLGAGVGMSSPQVVGHGSGYGSGGGSGSRPGSRPGSGGGGQGQMTHLPVLGYAGATAGEDDRESGPGVAGPLPTKSPQPYPQPQPLSMASPLSLSTAVSSGAGGYPPSPISTNMGVSSHISSGPADSSRTSILEQQTKFPQYPPLAHSPFEGDRPPHTPLTSLASRPSHSSNHTPPASAGTATGVSASGHESGMRVVNHDNPENLPTLPPGATYTHPHQPVGRRRAQQQHDGQPTFRRHADAGRVEAEVVDLPPLYSEVPRDGPRHSGDEEERV